jgi:Ca-activated chloride channel family protein
VAEATGEAASAGPGLKANFGADRVRRLEYLMSANYAGEELRAELARLGYETAPEGGAKVYAENARTASAKVVKRLLVRESLACGVPSSETAFVAVRSEPGLAVTETQVVANALPHGWSDGFASGKLLSGGLGATYPTYAQGGGMTRMAKRAAFRAPAAGGSAPQAPRPSGLPSPTRPSPPAVAGIRITVAAGQHAPADGAVLYDSAGGSAGQFTFLSVAVADVAAVDQELTLLLFVGDLTTPRARVRLADVLRQGERRPLNLRLAAGEPVRLTLEDPAGAWKAGVPALEIVLG